MFTTPSSLYLSKHVSEVKCKHTPYILMALYLTPDHSYLQVCDNFEDGGGYNFCDEYCGQKNYNSSSYQEPC